MINYKHRKKHIIRSVCISVCMHICMSVIQLCLSACQRLLLGIYLSGIHQTFAQDKYAIKRGNTKIYHNPNQESNFMTSFFVSVFYSNGKSYQSLRFLPVTILFPVTGLGFEISNCLVKNALQQNKEDNPRLRALVQMTKNALVKKEISRYNNNSFPA